MTPWEQNPQWVEDDLYIDFSRAQQAWKFDDSDHGMSVYFKGVDFVVEWTNQLWFLELKDPENGNIPANYQQEKREAFQASMKSKTLITRHLFPKFRDSLLYMGMDRGIIDKSFKYLTLIGLESVPPAELESLACALLQTELLKWPKRGWHKPFEVHCLNVTQWNRLLGDKCPVTRISHANQ